MNTLFDLSPFVVVVVRRRLPPVGRYPTREVQKQLAGIYRTDQIDILAAETMADAVRLAGRKPNRGWANLPRAGVNIQRREARWLQTKAARDWWYALGWDDGVYTRLVTLLRGMTGGGHGRRMARQAGERRRR